MQLEFSKIKDLYMSFDSAKLTSTIINLDIEELCHCFASGISQLFSDEILDGGRQVSKLVKSGLDYEHLDPPN